MFLNRLHEDGIKQRVALVYPFPYLDTVPSLCNAALLLSRHGFGVDIFTLTNPYYERLSFEDARIQVFIHKEKRNLIQRFIQNLRKEGSSNIDVTRESARSMSTSTKRFIPLHYLRVFIIHIIIVVDRILDSMTIVDRIMDIMTIWRHHRKCHYRCFIGVDPEGIVRAQQLSAFIRVPLVYWSFELLLSAELQSSAQRSLKHEEIASSHKASFIIIQDEDRARLLAEDNGFSSHNFVLVPNAPLGPARRRRLNCWHQRFGLSQHSKVVLHAGSMGDWTGISEVVASAPSWPEDWVLVIHTRFHARQSQYIQDLQRQAEPGKVFFSLHPVSRKEYDDLVDSADIGIAFYVPLPGSTYTQENLRSMGLSSGKIAYYLRAGLPVIINRTTSVYNLIEQENCGVAVSNGKEIGETIREIVSSYKQYSANAYRTFDKYMDFAGSFSQVIERIESL